MPKDKLRPKWMTVVDPSEYDVDKDMKQMVQLHNKSMELYLPMDVGKIWGLYLAWKKLREEADEG